MDFDDGRNRQFGFSFDQSRCTGCKTCQMACKDYHNLGDEVSFRTVCEYAGGDWRQNSEGSWEQNVFAFYVSMSCNHCTNPVCIRLCTRGAIHKDSLGFVVVDKDVCDGCQMCMVACPYHAPRFDEETGRVAKCDGCRDRVKNGLGPICVEACPQRALGFGMYEDLVDRPSMVEQVASMPNPHITLPNYSIMPSGVAKHNANDRCAILNSLEV